MSSGISGFLAELAVAAGRLAAERRRGLSREAIHCKHHNPADLVTDVDREVEAMLTAELRKFRPDYSIFGEENGVSGDGEYQFVIDPIDGTTSFVHDLPHYCVSIGLCHRGKSIAGAVYAPRLDELYTAELGGGAFLNGERIRVSECARLDAALFTTGFSCVRIGLTPDNFSYLPRLARLSQGFRCGGSAALDLCHTAAGKFEACWEIRLQPYDIAAGVIILTEAGGQITDLAGGDAYPERGTLGSNGLLHAKLLEFFHAPPGSAI